MQCRASPFLSPSFGPTAQQHLGIRMARVAQDSRSSTLPRRSARRTSPPPGRRSPPRRRYRGSQTRSTARAAFAARAAGSGSGFAPWRRGRWSAHPPAAAAGYRRAQGRSSPAGAFRRTYLVRVSIQPPLGLGMRTWRRASSALSRAAWRDSPSWRRNPSIICCPTV